MIRHSRTDRWCLPLLALGAMNAVAAQEAATVVAGNRQAAARPGIVEVRGAAYDPRRDDTAARIVVTQEEIVKYGDTTISDVLRRQPGITVNGAPGRGGEIRMRGLGSGYTQILLNGERVPAGFSIDSLAPGVIERIEILRAASAELSSEAIAGTINIILKRSASKAHREFKPAFGGGDGYLMPGFNLLLSDRTDSRSYSIAINGVYNQIRRSDPALEYGADANGAPLLERRTSNRYDSIFRGLFIVPRVTWTLAGGDSLSLQALINLTRFAQDSRLRTTTSLGAAPPYPDSDDTIRDQGDMARTELNWVHKLERGARLDTRLSATIFNNGSALDQGGFATDAAPALRRRVDLDARERGLAWTGKYTYPATTAHAISSGWDANGNRRTEDRVQRDSTVGGADVIAEASQAEVARLALYAQDEWTISPQYALYMGARWEGIRIHSEAHASEAVTSTSRIWSPVLQMLYKIPDTKSNQLRLALTRTYKAPAVNNLTPRRLVALNNSPTEPDAAARTGPRDRRVVPALLGRKIDAVDQRLDPGHRELHAHCPVLCKRALGGATHQRWRCTHPQHRTGNQVSPAHVLEVRPGAGPARQRQPQLVAGSEGARPGQPHRPADAAVGGGWRGLPDGGARRRRHLHLQEWRNRADRGQPRGLSVSAARPRCLPDLAVGPRGSVTLRLVEYPATRPDHGTYLPQHGAAAQPCSDRIRHHAGPRDLGTDLLTGGPCQAPARFVALARKRLR